MSELAPQRVGVIGSGLMGSGIAALFANQGVDVTLFDVEEALAQKALARLTDPKQKLPQLTSPRRAKRIRPAATGDYAQQLGECDLIVEVVPEILSLKQKVFQAVDQHRKPGSIVSTNTSGLSVDAMTEGCSDDLRAHFLGTHYFFPVRYLPLVELIPGSQTKPEVVAAYGDWLRRAGKRVVVGRDTPNFIANRIGVFAIARTIALAEQHGLTIEEVDLLTGPPLGNPKSASFRLADMVGLDTLTHTLTTSYENCPEDESREQLVPPALLSRLVEAGRLGEKSGSGFYKKVGKGQIETLDPETLNYRPKQSPAKGLIKAGQRHPLAGPRLKAMLEETEDPRARAFCRQLVLEQGVYALNRVGEIADDLRTIDQAMRWGFSRELGPIESLDALGLARAKELIEEAGLTAPALLDEALAGPGSFYGRDETGRRMAFVSGQGLVPAADDPRVLELARVATHPGPVAENHSARLLDLGDGVLCCELNSRFLPDMNPLDDQVIALLERAHEEIGAGRFQALVIANQAKNFSAGANLKAVLELAEQGDFKTIEAMVAGLQQVTLKNLHAPFPVVAAPHHLTLGGGLEVALGAQVRVAASELYCGLVEVGVGLVPAGGGCLRLLQLAGARQSTRGRPLGPMQNTLHAFDLIAFGKTSSSAEDARHKGLLAPDDVIHAAEDELVQVAKETALARLEGFTPLPEQPVFLPGQSGALVLEGRIGQLQRLGQITPHAAEIARVQARILSGGESANPTVPVSEEAVLAAEREGFLRLCGEELSRGRMAHMLKTGKPLFN